MIARTVVVVGPGGVGKSPLDALFRDDIVKIESLFSILPRRA